MKMKKMLSALLAVIMMCTLCSTAFAAEYDPADDDFCIDGVTVTVTYKENEQATMPTETDPIHSVVEPRYATKDLSANGPVNFTWGVLSESSSRSPYNFKTNSERIIVRMTAWSQSTYVTLKCYNTNGTEIFAKTIDVWTWWNAEFNITGLSALHTYYFVLSNNDQHNEDFNTTFSA